MKIAVIKSSQGFLKTMQEPVGGGGLYHAIWTNDVKKAWHFKGKKVGNTWIDAESIAAFEGLNFVGYRSARIVTHELIKTESGWEFNE